MTKKNRFVPGYTMAYQVLARKWRPQQFKDVVGQDHVVRTLENAVKTGRLAHAYLFVGPRGTGKTSLARIFAKVLNCKDLKNQTESCGVCDSCREITAGTSLDVIEIDGASNNGVDNIRDLRDTVQYAPVKGAFKMFIIDEIHMLSAGAFNALLKTLEEPPPHVKFLFATTEAEKVLGTIVSRCQRFDLRRIPVPLLIGRLKEVADAEQVKVDADALLAVARGAEGGLRDAESALDQLISFRGNVITEEDVLSVFGLVSRATLDQLADMILAADVEGILNLVAELDRGGKDFLRLVVEVLGHFRNILVFQHVKDNIAAFDIVDTQRDALKRQSEKLDTERVLRMTSILIETEEKMRYSLSRRTLLEAALIRCSRAATVVSIEELVSQLKSQGGLVSSGGAPVAQTRPAASSVAEAPSRPPVDTAAPQHRAAPVSASAPASQATSSASELKTLLDHWHTIGEKTERMAVGTRSILADARPLSVTGDEVVIGFDPEFADEADNFKKVNRNKQALQHVLSKELGREVILQFRLMEEGMVHKLPEPAPAARVQEAPAPAVSPTSPVSTAEKSDRSRTPKEWLADPVVEKTLNLFGGRIVDVRE